MINFKSYYDLSKDIAANVQHLPQVDIVVGIPKSGVIPAVIIASFLNVEYIDIDSFIFSNVKRKGVRRNNSQPEAKSRVLIVDDSINTGNQMRIIQSRLVEFQDRFDFVFCAVYGVSSETPADIGSLVLSIVPQPRVFQWNYRNHIIAESCCFDMDGVLCVDPPEEKNDDGPLYRDYILNAPPLFIPKKKISAIVTSRLERYRKETVEWLDKAGVQYGELIMLDLPTAEERRRLRAHAPFKAEVYSGRDELLFVESNWKQTKAIALATDKPVLCTENDAFLSGKAHVSSLDKNGQLFSYDQINIEQELRTEVADLSERLSMAVPELERELGSLLKDKPHKKQRVANAFAKERTLKKVLKSSKEKVPPLKSKGETMRVLMISRSFDPKVGAGAAMSSQRLRGCLQQHGLEVISLSLENIAPARNAKAAQPIKGTNIGYWASYQDLDHSAKLRNRIDLIDPDVIILGAVDSGILTVADLALINKPIVWIARDNWSHTGGCLFKLEPEAVLTASNVNEQFLGSLICDQYKSGCRSCPAFNHNEDSPRAALQYQLKKIFLEYRKDIVFAPISSWLHKFMEDAPLTADHKIITINNPIDLQTVRKLPSDKTTLRHKLGLPADKKIVLLNAHRLENPRKGFQVILDQLPRTKSLSDVLFVVMGSLKKSEIPSELRHQFHAFDFISDEQIKLEIYNSVDAVVVPALQESLSVVASDAIATGVPVIAFDGSGLTDLVEHKKNGWLAPAFDARELFNGLQWVLFEADAAQLQEACLAKAKAVLSSDVNTKKVIAACEEAIKQHKELSYNSDFAEMLSDILNEFNEISLFEHQARRYVEKQLKGNAPVAAPKPPVQSGKLHYGFLGWRRVFIPFIRRVVKKHGKPGDLEAFGKDPVGFMYRLKSPKYVKIREILFPQ
ncbi:glycosyltransferase [Coralliovum pocilloporae]|uniref:glycosyltransferase n=1 Tax=Coralliovum pocilloporae TaxID=3066369 RepID=UPI003307AD94